MFRLSLSRVAIAAGGLKWVMRAMAGLGGRWGAWIFDFGAGMPEGEAAFHEAPFN